jgi:hypothetical protein
VFSRLFRGRMLAMLVKAHAEGWLHFYGDHAALADRQIFKRFLAPLRRIEWVVYCKEPFAGPRQVLRYLSRYTHRVAISNRRLVSADDGGIAFRWKDYRITGPERWKTMTLAPAEFIRRFLIHVLPKGLHRIRHYGLLANTNRAESIARARQLLAAEPRVVEPEEEKAAAPDEPRVLPCPCPRCGGRMIVIEVFAKGDPAEVAAHTGIRDDSNRHVMRQTRLPARNMAGPIRWSCAGNDPTWPKAPGRRRKCPDGMLPERLSRRPSRPYAAHEIADLVQLKSGSPRLCQTFHQISDEVAFAIRCAVQRLPGEASPITRYTPSHLRSREHYALLRRRLEER